MYEKTEVTMENLGNGILKDKFELANKRIMNNIADLSTKATIKRKMIIEVTYTPKDDRGLIDIDVATKEKLAPEESVGTHIFSDTNAKGENIAVLDMNEQQNIPEMDKVETPITKIGAVK